ncbi:MAG: hypothetical protein N2109_02415 [Fimbriimonadales bacterium]|nr:hypothetical protein [Fimbriimonadales bacterium]
MALRNWVTEAILDEHWFAEAYKRLLVFARKRLERYCTERGSPGDLSLDARTAEDFVSDAFLKVLEGQRNVPANVLESGDRPLLLQWLIDVVASMINNAGRVKGARTVSLENGPEGLPMLSEVLADRRAEASQCLRDLYLSLLPFVEDDPELTAVLNAWFDGCTTPQDFAAELGIEVPEANNLLRRFKRRLRKFLEEKSLPEARHSDQC